MEITDLEKMLIMHGQILKDAREQIPNDSCLQIMEKMGDLYHNLLSFEEKNEVKNHLKECPHCFASYIDLIDDLEKATTGQLLPGNLEIFKCDIFDQYHQKAVEETLNNHSYPKIELEKANVPDLIDHINQIWKEDVKLSDNRLCRNLWQIGQEYYKVFVKKEKSDIFNQHIIICDNCKYKMLLTQIIDEKYKLIVK